MFEILFGVLGLVMMVSGRIPQSMFQMLFGKGYFDAAPATARKFGLLLLAPASLIILIIALMMVLLGGEPDPYVPWAEVAALMLTAFIALRWARSFRKPALPEPEPAQAPVLSGVEAPKDVYSLSDHEIRQKLGLEPPNITEMASATLPPPQPTDRANIKKRKLMVVIIGFLAGVVGPLLMLAVSLSTDTPAGTTAYERVMVYVVIGLGLVMGIFFVVFFALRAGKD